MTPASLGSLGSLISTGRSRKAWSQLRLCRAVHLSEPMLSGVENGKRVPSLPVVVRLFEQLTEARSEEARQDELARWLAAWVVAEAGSPTSSKLNEALDADLRALLAAGASRLARAVRHGGGQPSGGPWSLGHLSQTGPFVAICGDRRESEPKSLADLFILSGAVSDVMWLPKAREGVLTSVRSDKLVVQLAEDSLRDELGRHNLLVIGGPNVNWAARVLNPSALWRFRIEPGWETWDGELRKHAELNQRSILKAFSAVLNAGTLRSGRDRLIVDERAIGGEGAIGERALGGARQLAERMLRGPDGRLHKPKEIIAKFQTGGLVDPIEGIVHDVSHDAETDLAMVSFAPHPWARDDDLIAVMVAGLGGPATAEALRILLEEPSAFEGRPCGGVIEIQLPAYENWASRFREPGWAWVTSPYEPGDLDGRLTDGAARDLVARLIGRQRAAVPGGQDGLTPG